MVFLIIGCREKREKDFFCWVYLPYVMTYMNMDVLHESDFSFVLFFLKYGKMFTQTSIFYEKVLSRYYLWEFFQKQTFEISLFEGQIWPKSHQLLFTTKAVLWGHFIWPQAPDVVIFSCNKKIYPLPTCISLHVKIFFFMTRKSNI